MNDSQRKSLAVGVEDDKYQLDRDSVLTVWCRPATVIRNQLSKDTY